MINSIFIAQGDILDAKSPQKLKNIVANTTGIYLESDRFLRIESEYINTALSNMEKLLEAVYDKSFSAP